MEEKIDSIIIKLAETDEELCGRGYVHCTALMAAKAMESWHTGFNCQNDKEKKVSFQFFDDKS